jgi:hypothetical protein
MVEIIGVATVVALSWLLAASMATESDSEKRRAASSSETLSTGEGTKAKHAA